MEAGGDGGEAGETMQQRGVAGVLWMSGHRTFADIMLRAGRLWA